MNKLKRIFLSLFFFTFTVSVIEAGNYVEDERAIDANSMEAVITWNWNLKYGDYSVDFYDDAIMITTPRPSFTVNILYNDGNREVDLGYDVSEIDFKVYEEINSLWGKINGFLGNCKTYPVRLRYKGIDKYGSIRYTKSWKIGTLSEDDVRKYQSAGYFHDVSKMIMNDLRNQD